MYTLLIYAALVGEPDCAPGWRRCGYSLWCTPDVAACVTLKKWKV